MIMTVPITVTVTGSGSKDLAVCQKAREVSSPMGVSLKSSPPCSWYHVARSLMNGFLQEAGLIAKG